MLQREYTSDCKAFWNHRHCRWFSLYKKRADSEQVQIRSLLDWKLFQSELYTRGRIVHPEEDGCDLAADNGAVGVEGTLLVRAGQDARTIECVNFIRTLVAQLHVRDRVVGNVVERLVAVHRRIEDGHKLTAGRRGVHLRSGVVGIALVQNAVRNAVFDIAVIPVGLAVHQRHLASILHLMQRGGQLDRLSHGQCAVRFVGRSGHAVDQEILPELFLKSKLIFFYGFNRFLGVRALYSRFQAVLTPTVYGQFFKADIYNKATDTRFSNGITRPNTVSLGLGGALSFRYRIASDWSLQLKNSFLWMTDNKFDGITTPYGHTRHNVLWMPQFGILWTLK